MPDDFHPNTPRKSRRSRLLVAAGASCAIFTLIVGVAVKGAASASGASTSMPAVALRDQTAAGTSFEMLFGLPDRVQIIGAEETGEIVRFAALLAGTSQAVAAPPAAQVEAPAAPVQPAALPAEAPPPVQQAPAPQPTPTQPAAAPPPPPPPPPPARTATPAVGAGLDTSPMNAYEQALFDATNARRASQGMAPLRVNGYLIGVARLRSQDMVTYDYFAHVSPISGLDAFNLMNQYGVPYVYAGENLAMNNYPKDEAVGVADQALWDSPPHRENILNPYYTDMGIALRTSADGMHYFTIVFTGPGG